jgi:hypothetical protein
MGQVVGQRDGADVSAPDLRCSRANDIVGEKWEELTDLCLGRLTPIFGNLEGLNVLDVSGLRAVAFLE